jgi:hypothetical protein
MEALTMYIRSLALRCATCIYYVHTPNAAGVQLGTCRRLAPSGRGWPAVAPADWCGEHTLDELALPRSLPRREDLEDDSPLPLHDPTDCRFCQEQETAIPFAPEDL